MNVPAPTYLTEAEALAECPLRVSSAVWGTREARHYVLDGGSVDPDTTNYERVRVLLTERDGEIVLLQRQRRFRGLECPEVSLAAAIVGQALDDCRKPRALPGNCSSVIVENIRRDARLFLCGKYAAHLVTMITGVDEGYWAAWVRDYVRDPWRHPQWFKGPFSPVR